MSERSKIANFSELIRMVPEKWRSAEIYVADSAENLDKISRVSFHKDASGKRVILLHKHSLRFPEN